MPRRNEDWASLVPPELMAAGAGPSGGTAYDRTSQDVPDVTGASPAPAAGGDVSIPVPDAPVGILAGPDGQAQQGGDAGTTDNLTGTQLGELAGGGGGASPDEAAFQEMQAALQDPNTPPEVRQQIEQQIALEARRQMLGGV